MRGEDGYLRLAVNEYRRSGNYKAFFVVRIIQRTCGYRIAFKNIIQSFLRQKIFYQRMKGELEVAIKNLSFSKLIILKPGLLERPKTNRTGEKLILPVIKTFNKIGLFNSQKPLPTSTLAQAMANIGKQKNIESKDISGIEIFKYADL